MIIELDDGKFYRKPLYLMVKTYGFPVKIFPTKPIHWNERVRGGTCIAWETGMVQNIGLAFVMGAGGTAQVGGYYDDELVDRWGGTDGNWASWPVGKCTYTAHMHINRSI